MRKNMTHRNHAKDRNDTWTKVTDGNWKVPHMTINRFMRYLFRILVWHSEQLFHYFCARIGFFFLANTGTQMQKKNREFPGFCHFACSISTNFKIWNFNFSSFAKIRKYNSEITENSFISFLQSHPVTR